jgi:formamidopyrimidine-DNA glycosylase
MPELPEVEVTRRSFADRIAGAQIEKATLGKPLRWPLGLLPQALAGKVVLGVRRRGKYLLLDLSEGLLLIHLGMSGSLRFAGRDEEPLGTAERMITLTCRHRAACCACMIRAASVP